MPLEQAKERAQRDLESAYIKEALQKESGDRKRAAALLNLSPAALGIRIKELGIDI